MVFNSLAFVVFAAIFFVSLSFCRGRLRLYVYLVASYFFYGWWDWRFTSLLLISTAVDFFVGKALGRTDSPSRRRRLLIVSICANLGILGFFKYFNFFLDSLNTLLEAVNVSSNLPILEIVLPVGISFYVFQTMSYTIDVYRRKMKPEKDWLTFATYVALFPQLVAGPIVRASHLLPQLRKERAVTFQKYLQAIELIAWGYFLKLCLADTAAIVVDSRFDNPAYYQGFSHLLGLIAFAFQIYGDFCGYSLIAIGLGQLMGLDFGINFNRPYFATSFSDFWRRWHISLSTWIRDYVYIPLGGHVSESRIRTFRNLFITMFLAGLWHGAGWTFVLWGVLHGIFLAGQRLFGPFYQRGVRLLRVPAVVSNLGLIGLVFTLNLLAWLLFRSDSLAQAQEILTRIVAMDSAQLRGGEQIVALAKTAVFIVITVAVDWLSSMDRVRAFCQDRLWIRVLGVSALVWIITLMGVFDGASFIYFQF